MKIIIVCIVLFTLSMFGGAWFGAYTMGFNNQHIYSSFKVMLGMESIEFTSAWLVQACRRSLPEV